MGTFTIPKAYKSRYFFVLAQLYDPSGRLVSQADYWPRTIPLMEDSTYRMKYVSAPCKWPSLADGPWLKPAVAKNKTQLQLGIHRISQIADDQWALDVTVANKGKLPSFMTRLEIEGIKRLFFADDNFFWLQPGETKHIHLEFKAREDIRNKQAILVLSSWNASVDKKEIKLHKQKKSNIQ